MLLLAGFFLALPANASITFDSASGTDATVGATALSFTHTLGTGSNRLVVCSVQIADYTAALALDTPTVTYGGIGMTAISGALYPTTSKTSKIQTEMFYLDDNTIGSLSGVQAVSVSLASAPTGGIAASCSSYAGVAQTGPAASGENYTGSDFSAGLTVILASRSVGDLIVDSLAGGYTLGSAGKTIAVESGQTLLTDENLTSGGIAGGTSYEIVSAAGSVTTGWTDANVSRGAYAVAAFTGPTDYTVTTSVSPSTGGNILLSPSGGSYASGTAVQATATPASYYSFTNFTDGNNNVLSSANPYSFTVSANSTVTANFSQNMCTLTVNVVGNGSATPSSGSYACGSTVSLTATPSSGYYFESWAGSGYASTTSSTGSFTLTANTIETVTFVSGFSVGITTSGSGSVNVSSTVTANSDGTYPSGAVLTLTATPASGYYFAGYSGGVTNSSSILQVTVTSNLNITATFNASTIVQDAVSNANSTGSASSLTWTHTLGSGSSRFMVIEVATADSTTGSPDANATVTGVYYNGVYATPVPNSQEYIGTTGMAQTQLFYLTDAELPSTAGTYTVDVELTGSVGGISAGAITLFNANQGTPEAVATSAATCGSSTCSLNVAITTLSSNAWLVGVASDNEVETLAVNNGQTLSWTGNSTVGTGGSSTELVASPGATTMGWSATANALAESVISVPPATQTVPATYTLTTATSSTDGSTSAGSITSNPSIASISAKTAVLLTAVPATGYAFSSWSGDTTSLISSANSTVNPVSIVMDASHTVTANFTTAATCSITYTVTGSGTVSVVSGSTYTCGTSVQLIATPSTGYTFASWGGDVSSTSNPYTFTLNSNANITVNFVNAQQCTLTTAVAGSGTVTPATETVVCGSTVSLGATPATGAAFTGWSGDYTGVDNPHSLTLSTNMSVTANFGTGSICSLTVAAGSNGSVTPTSASMLCGSKVTVTATPNSGYMFEKWNGSVNGSENPKTIILTASSMTANASFAPSWTTAYATSSNNYTITGDSTRTVTEPVYPAIICTKLYATRTVATPNDSSMEDTSAVQSALNACTAGEAVEFSRSNDGNDYNAFVIGPITLPTGVTMLIDPEVTILGSIKYADYSCNTSESWCNPLIEIAPNTSSSTGSAIMGLGTIDGRGGTSLTDKGESFWATGSDTRPRLIYLGDHASGDPADYFTIYKVTLRNSPKFHVSGVGNYWTAWGVKIYAPPDSPNTDGIDPSGSSNVTITKSYISDGDDWVSPKADSGREENFTVSDNYFYSGHGVSVGSETNDGFDNMIVKNDVIDNGFGGSSVNSLRIKSDSSRGGAVYNILYKDVCIKNGGDTIVINPYYSSGTGSLIPDFHDIIFSNVTKTIYTSAHKSTIIGYDTSPYNYPAIVTLDSVDFVGETSSSNEFKEGSTTSANFFDDTFTYGPGNVNFASLLVANSADSIAVTNSISDTSTTDYYDCGQLNSANAPFVYLTGDLTSAGAATTYNSDSITSSAAANGYTLTAVLQNVVSPVEAGTLTYYQNSMPTGTIEIYEESTLVASETITSGNRLTSVTVPAADLTVGTHAYTATYVPASGSSYTSLNFGAFVLTVTSTSTSLLPVANAQTVSVQENTAQAITLTGTNSPTSFMVVSSPADGTLSGTAPSLTYTPNTGYTGTDSFTFTATNSEGTSSAATVSLTVSAPVVVSPTLAWSQPSSITYGTSLANLLDATASYNYSAVSGSFTYAATSSSGVPQKVTSSTVLAVDTWTLIATFASSASGYTSGGTASVQLSVTQATPVVFWSQPSTINYGTSLTGVLNATAAYNSSALNGTMVYIAKSSSGAVQTVTGSTVLSAGSWTLTATFSPSDTTDYVNNQTASVPLTVRQINPTLAWSQPSSIVYGTSLANVLNATASYNSNTVQGTFSYVAVQSNTSSPTITKRASASGSGQTVTSSTDLTAGTWTLTATFLPGDTTDYVSNGTASVTLVVSQDMPQISWSKPSTINYGTNLSGVLNATATYNSSTVAGSFGYTATSSSGSKQTVTNSAVLPAGSWTLTASFTPSDSTDYINIETQSVSLVVNQIAPTHSVGSSSGTAVSQNQVTFTATVTSSVSSPTGTVTFYDGSTSLGTVSVSGGVAELTTSSLSTGTHTIYANYSGDGNFLSESSSLTETIVAFTLGTASGGSGSSNSSSGASQVVEAGGTASFEFPITSSSSTLPVDLKLSLSGLPSDATVSVLPSTWNKTSDTSWTLPAGSSLSGNVQINIMLPANSGSASFTHCSMKPLIPISLAFLLMPLLGRVRRAGKNLSRMILIALLAVTTLGLGIGLTGCSGGYMTQTQQSYSITATVSAGTLSQTETLSLTVE
ncbi:InlB B-repeat-containing protein [Telmatobacter bradus]|uniref:InlB B-repeat-containing protein n=1 Tax=Telmatobacter bradus TaxID=474953 RepID=UPI003B4377E9